ncbi:MAG: TMEM165/GDT1 family protein [Candidatus Nanopelagicales bacterium]|jgi:putative Ca2+/H+ antiporter (TMEM165/GDT1 family)
MNWVVDIGLVVATFAVIFPAELPDKSFIATLVLATRFPRLMVWLGAVAAFGIQMVIAVAAGQLLSLLPEKLVLGVTAALFAVGAVILVRGGLKAREEEMAEEQEEAEEIAARASGKRTRLAAFGTTFAVIFTAEWGDLTQLVTAGQAARTGQPLSVFLGSWLALATVAGIGALAGSWLQKRIPLWRVRLISGALLAVLAAVTLVELVNG